MKIQLRALVAIIAAVLILSGVHTDVKADNIKKTSHGVRQSFISDKGVETLYAIDDYMTYMVTKADWKKPNSGHTVVYSRFDGDKKYYMIRHDVPEPLRYKSWVLPELAEFESIEPGKYTFIEGGSGYGGIDLYQHSVAACAKLAGEITFVIPRSNGKLKRLTKVDALSAFTHILSNSAGRDDTVWYIACDGEERFMVEKNYRSLSGGIEMATVNMDMGLQGVNYAENWGAPEEPSGIFGKVTAKLRKPTGKPHKPSKKFLMQMAREVVFMKGNLVRIEGTSRYTGYYSGSPHMPECESVSIKHIQYEPVKNHTRVDAYDYQLCDDKMKMVGTSKKTSPGKLNIFAMFLRGLPF